MTSPVPIAPMMADMVRKGIMAVDGTVFEDLDRCPHCGGAVRPHDYRAKRFATVTEGAGTRDVHVHVKRFRCGRCGRLCYAASPFYSGTRHGAPVVELAAVLAWRLPPGRAAQALGRLGIVLDRATVRSYARRLLPPITTMDLFGIPIPVSLLQLPSTRSRLERRGAVTTPRPGPLHPAPPAQQGQQRQEEDDEEEWGAEQVKDRADRE